MSGPTFNQTHSGSGDNIVNLGKQPFVMDDENVAYLISQCSHSKPVVINTTGIEATEAGHTLCSRLSEMGFKVSLGKMVGASFDASLSFPPRSKRMHPVLIEHYDNATVIDIET